MKTNIFDDTGMITDNPKKITKHSTNFANVAENAEKIVFKINRQKYMLFFCGN